MPYLGYDPYGCLLASLVLTEQQCQVHSFSEAREDSMLAGDILDARKFENLKGVLIDKSLRTIIQAALTCIKQSQRKMYLS